MIQKKIFKRLDKRNTGYGHWEYYINRPSRSYRTAFMSLYESQQVFFSWREWCWQTWGAGKELDDWLEDLRHTGDPSSHNEHWCFQNNEYGSRIYLRTDKELSMFLLRWSQ